MKHFRQGQQLSNAMQMHSEMVRNGRALPAQQFGAVTTDLNALVNIAQGGAALAYSMGNLDGRFRGAFPGYGALPNNYYPSSRNWAQTSLDTTAGEKNIAFCRFVLLLLTTLAVNLRPTGSSAASVRGSQTLSSVRQLDA